MTTTTRDARTPPAAALSLIGSAGGRRPGRLPRPTERRVGLAILAACGLGALAVPRISRWDVTAFAASALEPPSWAHPFGTDQLGRDVLTRAAAAVGLDLAITLVAVAACLATGTMVGLLLILAPKLVRNLALRLVDAFLAIPFILLVLLAAGGLESKLAIGGVQPRIAAVMVAIVLSGWAPYARFTVTRALALRERESIVAARLLGYSPARVLVKHMAPAVMSTNLSYAAAQAVGTVGTVASLAFLGVGVTEPAAELGQMMQAGIGLLPVAWWVAIVPGLAVLVIGTGFGLVADSLAEEASQ
ncbi:MAG: ABC transporter permease [Bifidobacteriaceae bacterium]|jgi:peptide/nickel transport system permease protein|nr:ABC transporter permease [Bifidobacteriaceae bacterium]